MKNAKSEPVYLCNYQVPDYFIEKVNLDFELDERRTMVTSTLYINVNPASKKPHQDLVLFGESLSLYLFL